jgi:hypothetical protein
MRTRTTRTESGGSAIIVAFSLILLGALAAMAINMGQIMMVRGQLQNAVDAGALAGAKGLTVTLGGLDGARLSAQDFVGRHQAGSLDLIVDLNPTNDPAGDIVLGEWDFGSPGTFRPINAVTDADARRINAVRVHAARSGDTALPVVLTGFLNRSEVSLGAEAIAVGGGPCEGCVIPVVFPECMIVNPNDGSLMCNRDLLFKDATEDNLGLTSLTDSNPNTPSVIAAFDNGCTDVGIGDTIGVSNGANMSSPRLCAEFQNLVGQQVTAPIIATGGGSCDNFQFVQRHEIYGFASFRITGVTCRGQEQEISIEFLCDQGGADDNAVGGCANFGTIAPQTRLVR